MNPFGSDLPPPTHRQADPFAVMKLARELQGRATGGLVAAEALEAFAEEAGHPRALAYVALGMHPMIQLDRRHPTAFLVCTGRCQLWGSLDRLERLLTERDARQAAGQGGFDVVPMGCLDVCEKPPALVLSSPDGRAVLPSCNDELLAEALESV